MNAINLIRMTSIHMSQKNATTTQPYIKTPLIVNHIRCWQFFFFSLLLLPHKTVLLKYTRFTSVAPSFVRLWTAQITYVQIGFSHWLYARHLRHERELFRSWLNAIAGTLFFYKLLSAIVKIDYVSTPKNYMLIQTVKQVL